MKAVVGELVDVSATRSGRWVGDACGDVFEPELLACQPRHLKDDPPGTVEVRNVDLQAAGEARPRGVLGIAMPSLIGGETFALIASASSLEGNPSGFGQACEVGGEEGVVEVDGSVDPSGVISLDRSALAVRGQRWTVAPLELRELLCARGTAPVASMHIAHRLSLRSRGEFLEYPDNEAVQLFLCDVKALGDFPGAEALGDQAQRGLVTLGELRKIGGRRRQCSQIEHRNHAEVNRLVTKSRRVLPKRPEWLGGEPAGVGAHSLSR